MSAELELANALTVAQEATKRADEMRGKIFALESVILKHPQTEFKINHHFAPGVYVREGLIPKGTVLTGAIHKTEHLNIIVSGDISVWTEDGMKRINGFTILPSKPGIKRVGYAHEDTIWINVCHNPTNEQNVEKLEALLSTNNYQDFLDFIKDHQSICDHSGGKN